MKASEVYRTAANNIAIGLNGLTCIAISDAADYFFAYWTCPEVREYSALFLDGGEDYDDLLNPKEARILALCFMAAIAEDEERGNGRRSS